MQVVEVVVQVIYPAQVHLQEELVVVEHHKLVQAHPQHQEQLTLVVEEVEQLVEIQETQEQAAQESSS